VSRPHHVLPLREAMAAADGDAPARATEALAKARETVHAAVPELRAELVSTEIVDGPTPEAAIHKLDWHDGDLLIVGSGRLAAPRRLFLGSTAAKMLRVVPVPTVVVPNPEPNESE
jgi:nucleotide-binding universal stress UspA family protein